MEQLTRGVWHRVAERQAEREADDEAAQIFDDLAMAPNTRRAYGRQWRSFVEWAVASSDQPMPAEPAAIRAYLASMARSGASFSRINLARAAIAAAHKQQGHASPTHHPTVARVLRGIGRELGTATRPKRALTCEQVLRMADVDWRCPTRTSRNRALLLLAFSLPLRRSEVAALRCSDIEVVDGGIDVTVRRSKTNQLGKRDVRAVPALVDRTCCPCAAVAAWMAHAKRAGNVPLWPSISRTGGISYTRHLDGHAVARIVKSALKAIGVDPTHYSGHSLRRGSLTSAAHNGAELPALMRQAGHKDPKTTMGYIDEGKRMGSGNASRFVWAKKKGDET